FEKSRRREEPFTDFYVWHKGKILGTGEPWYDGAENEGKQRIPPNNWLSFFGGSAWKLDPVRNEYFQHNFNEDQAALNLNLPKVQDALFQELKFMTERSRANSNGDTPDGNARRKTGVIGARLDAISTATHDPNLGNNDWKDGWWPNNPQIETFKLQHTTHN